MNYLLSTQGFARLADLLATQPLLAFDFDGTLAPITLEPSRTKLSAAVLRLLGRLCTSAPVAIISGRSIADLRNRIDFQPKYLIGNHGAEGLPESEYCAEQLRSTCKIWMKSLYTLLNEYKVDPGIMLEDKEFTLSLHYRLARDKNAAQSLLHDIVAKLCPTPEIILGKCVINLLPHGALNKRLALERLLKLENKQAALYIGDDDTDEIVFRNAPHEWVTVRVEPILQSNARYFLCSQTEVGGLLQLLMFFYSHRQIDQKPSIVEAIEP